MIGRDSHTIDGDAVQHGPISRRKWLRAVIATSGVSLAGCIGGDGDQTDDDDEATTDDDDGATTDDDDADPGEGGEPFVDTPLRFASSLENPSELNLNPHAANFQHELSWPLNARMGGNSQITGEWIHLDVEYWEVDEEANELHVKIKDDVHWHQDGEIIDDVTAEDWVMQMEMEEQLMVPEDSLEENPLIVGWHVDESDDKILVEELNPDGYNDQMATNPSRFWRRPINQYRNGWVAEYYEQLVDTTDEEDRNEIREEVLNETVYITDDPPFSGPYFVEEVTPRATEMRRNPDHWSAEVVNFDRFEMVNVSPEGGADYQAAANDQADLGFSIPETVDSPPENIKEIVVPGNFGEGLAINYGGDIDPYMTVESGEPAGERQALIRQAIAHAVDLRNVVLNRYGERVGAELDPSEKPFPGAHFRIQEEFPDLWDQVPSFVEAEPDVAEEKLERAGLERDGETWVTPDGDPLVVECSSFSWVRETMETVVHNLSEIGVTAEHRVVEDSVMFSNLDTGDFGIAQAWMDFDNPMSERSAFWLSGGWPAINAPEEYQIPPVGDYEASPTETINVAELSADFMIAPEEEHTEETRTLMWAHAYHVPFLPMHAHPAQVGLNTEHFEWPEPIPEGQFTTADENHHPVWAKTEPRRMLRRGIEGLRAKE